MYHRFRFSEKTATCIIVLRSENCYMYHMGWVSQKTAAFIIGLGSVTSVEGWDKFENSLKYHG